MSEPFRTRSFQPVPAAERQIRRRRAARVVVLHDDAVLLLADTDPGLPGTRWWVTPGGGIDPGESALEAAVRELGEELGVQVAIDQLLGPVAVREVVHGYSDQILCQHEQFFVFRSQERFTPSQEGLTADEQVTLAGWAWLRIDTLHTETDPVWPQNLATVAGLADRPEHWPIELGEMEESTVPVK